ncbi:ABC transporter ATP-binding protein [Ochrovirga pacifica]|uniref:ABC transporter ATP-binding protein n=1 Tax=Ochrovirga pacifica TaxID=1042376 RepID=UPI000255775C|nr:ATP-binding cassette domain-containing protein [Ochrovirga pacifica]
MQDSFLVIENLSKSYRNKIALNSVSFQIPQGSVYGLIGQNGAGKTTLIRILNKIIDADSGQVLFKGEKIDSNTIAHIGYLPEERGLYKNMTIEEQALYFGQLKEMSKPKAIAAMDYWLQRFDILDWKKKKIEDLSKGMAQKVQFIIAVLHQPELLILDEPFSGFDPINADLIAQEIKELSKQGTTIIFSSHRMESVSEMCDDVCLIHKGTTLLQGSIEKIQEQYANEVYEIGLTTVNPSLLTEFLNNAAYQTKRIAQTPEKVSLETSIVAGNSSELLQTISGLGTVHLFKKHVPTLQEIFIKTIQNA